ncbi:MAG: hypothetical protein SNH13_00415 [Rikenellaceae bacterium]
MYSLYIDGVKCDLDSSQSIVMSFDSASLTTVDAHREGLSLELELESTAVNDAIFGGDGYLHAAERFNAQQHEASIEYEAQQIVVGTVTLKSVSWQGGEPKYLVTVEEQSAGWAHNAAEGRFDEIEVDFTMELCREDIVSGWGESEPAVNFIAVHRDSYEYEQSSVSSEAVRVIKSIDQYHPFLHVATLMESIVESGGYEICSEFMAGDEFRSLYMSGAYSSVDSSSTLAVENMGFYVERLESGEAVADAFGRVFLTASFATNSVGNFVDVDSVEQVADCYNRGGCLSLSSGVLEYRPLSTIDVGFEIRLKYTTEYEIESRTKLKGFDCFALTLGQEINFDIINTFEDRRDEARSNFDYLLIIFDYEEDMNYRVRAYLEDGETVVTLMELDSNSDHLITPTYAYENLFIEQATTWGNWETYEGDWAIYDGYLEYRGVTDVDVTLRIAASECSPTSPFTFVTPYMTGAELGWGFTLKSGSSMTPYFTNYPGEGEIITYVDVAKHDISQSLFFEAIVHLYNLRFYSDNLAKVLYIEPYDIFYGDRSVWDWSDRIITDADIELEDASAEVNRRHKWGYQSEDGYINRLNSDTGEVEEYGLWELSLNSYISPDATSTHLNELYSPSCSDDEDLLIVGDRDDVELADSLDFAARVVRVDGTMTYEAEQMPYIAFHSSQRGISLCFEDRDGVTGLNQHYLNEMSYIERGRIVTLSLSLSVDEMNALLSPCQGKAFLWDTFILTLGGEPSRARLRAVESFSPAEGVARCKFIVID